jgi:uncharacterized protein (TIGR00288 family)
VEQRNQLAVFIDFDNIEIGVKSTLNTTLDLSMVLDALKERGEVVSKSAYGDWARAGTHSRTLTDHAVHMVQRNVTPRGDKNGADINLVVDALEMCFTHPHIDGFAIVGGDSDFIALVEKLKQFGKRVYIVGGRGFTSGTMQRNCHEFISYENLLGGGRGGRGGGQNRGGGGGRMSLDKGFEKVQRALKILADKGVQPQLGPIKSTLLQLDSTFSERDFGVSSFREFIQKLADKRLVTMKRIDQGYLVESNSDNVPEPSTDNSSSDDAPSSAENSAGSEEKAADSTPAKPEAPEAPASTEPIPPEEGLRLLGQAAVNLAEKRSGKPVYVRHLAQELRAIVGEFDESRFGFRTLTEMAHEAQKAGLLSMQRDRVGAWRVTAATGATATDAKKSDEPASEGNSETTGSADGTNADDAGPAKTASTRKATTKKAPAKKTAAKKTATKTTTKKATTKKAAAKKTTAKKATTKKATTKKTAAKKTAAKKADDS